MPQSAQAVHVAQISFFCDPAQRLPAELLEAWPSLVDVAEAAAGAGAQVSVIQASTHTGTVVRNGIAYYFLPFGRMATGRTAENPLRTLLSTLSPDVAHVQGLGFVHDVLALAALAPRLPIMLQDHADRLPRPWRRRSWRSAFAAGAAVSFSSRAQAAPFRRSGLLGDGTRVFEIPECPSRFSPGDQATARAATGLEGDPCLLWVGHLDRNKDPLTVLAGVSQAAQRLPQLRLWCCYGTAPLLAPVKRRIARDPLLAPRVRLLGRVPHERIEQLMRAADVFVLGSHREGSGYSLIEALACGLPPVVTDIPSFRTLTDGGAAGSLWPCGDSGALAAALVAVAAKPRSTLRAAAREHFERELSFAAVGRKLCAAYRELLENRPHPGANGDRGPDPGRGSSVPAVSVILPTFNRPAYLREAIASVRKQSFDDWELVIADDGSGAEVREYLHTLHDPPRIRVLTLEHTGNPPAVRNRALREARGEYVAFLDSDDIWLPDKLQRQLAALRARTDRAWSYTGFTLIDSRGAPLAGAEARTCPAIEGAFLEPLLRGEPLIMQSSVVVRRELLERLGGYDEALRVCGDYELWIRLAQHSEVGLIETPLLLVRRNAERYFDDVTALAELDRMLAKLQRSAGVAHLAALLRARRARVATQLALSQAQGNRRLGALGTLLSSAPRAWRFRSWWIGAARGAAHALLPTLLLGMMRRRRVARRNAPRTSV